VSDTAGEKGRVRRIRQRRTVTILRDDHLGDPIGIIFLDPESADHDSLVARLRDYLGADGAPGYFRQRLYVYERRGRPCRRCGTPVRAVTQGQRSTYYCPSCQK